MDGRRALLAALIGLILTGLTGCTSDVEPYEDESRRIELHGGTWSQYPQAPSAPTRAVGRRR